MAIFMPYIWVDDPIAFASGREVYGFAKTQGWMRRLDNPRKTGEGLSAARPPDPPGELVLDVYGATQYGPGSEIGRQRLLTITRATRPRRGIPARESPPSQAEGDDLASLVGHLISELDPNVELETDMTVHRSIGGLQHPIAGARHSFAVLAELLSEQQVRHVFLKQIRDAEHGDAAALQQVVEASATVTPGSLHWRRLRGTYELAVQALASHPLEEELGLVHHQTIRFAFAAEFGFRMEAGAVRWP
jgi:hypothetical protein